MATLLTRRLRQRGLGIPCNCADCQSLERGRSAGVLLISVISVTGMALVFASVIRGHECCSAYSGELTTRTLICFCWICCCSRGRLICRRNIFPPLETAFQVRMGRDASLNRAEAEIGKRCSLFLPLQCRWPLRFTDRSNQIMILPGPVVRVPQKVD